MKRNLFLSLALALSLLINFNFTFAEGFNSVSTPDGNYVIAAGDNGLIFRSNNGGNTWASYTEPLVDFKCVFTLGSNVWLTGDNGKIYKSSTTSNTITPYNTPLTTSINSICFVDANTGFFCGDNGTIYKTIDGGITWISKSISTPLDFNSISFKDSQNGIAVGEGGISLETTNGGSSWTNIILNYPRELFTAKYFTDGWAFAGEWGSLFVKPNGSPWTQVPTRIRTDIRGISGSSINDIHVCGGGGFIRNNTNGNSGFLNFEKNPMLANLVDIVYFGNKGFAVSSLNNVIIRTLNGGATWSLPTGSSVIYNWEAKPGASGNFLGNNLSLHPTDNNTVFIAFGNKVYRSMDKGDVWSQVGNSIPSGNTPHSFFVSPLDTNIWLVATEGSPDQIYRTTDYGLSWVSVMQRNFSNYGQPLEMDQNNPRVFYFAPDNGGFYKSADNGATFTEISNSYPFRSPCDILVQWDNSSVIFLADGITSSGQAKLFKSRDGGLNWANVHTTSSSEIPSMCNTVFDSRIVWATEWGGSNIYKSTNSGDSFVTHHNTGFSGWGSDICHEDPSVMITGSWGSRATLSLDAGETWTEISSGLSGHGGGIIIPDKGYVLAHQGSNIYKLKVTYSVITSVNENTISSIPQKFELSQNYPNPFNPTTRIVYNLPKSGNVVLKVYNELGKEVNTLVNDYKNAGSYEITFDASSLSSGIYFYKLQSDGLIATKKMLLVK
ncbi:MAG: YCF48-related protein [Bacteroidota bacterium]|nr:YCF48-related protein [Bacteroidota bacterium]